MTKWEYEEFEFRISAEMVDPTVALIHDLNEVGKDGWELVSYQKFGPIETASSSSDDVVPTFLYLCFCKRQLP